MVNDSFNLIFPFLSTFPGISFVLQATLEKYSIVEIANNSPPSIFSTRQLYGFHKSLLIFFNLQEDIT